MEQRVAAMARQLLTYERRETELRRQVGLTILFNWCLVA